MQTVQFKKFGPPEVLELADIPIPTPHENELLIKIYAAGINPIDAKIREGSSFVAKQLTLPASLGFDMCGEVIKSNAPHSSFKVGDIVLGSVGRYDRPSTYAEFCLATPDDLIKKPEHLDPIQAAALTTAGLTAWQALHTIGKVKAGEKVLIHAAAGGVGHIALQLAKLAHAHVIVTASQHHHEFLKQLGADEIIDYTQQAFETNLKNIDLVIDLVGGETGLRSLSVLAPQALLVTVPTITRDLILAEAKKRNLNATGMLAEMNLAELENMANLVANKQLKVHVSKVLPLSEAVLAHITLEQKRTQGKMVLTLQG